MSVKISFKDVSYHGYFENFSCEINSGYSVAIITSGDMESSILTRLITGMSSPSHGSVLIGNQDIAKLDPEQRYRLRQLISIVPYNDGLISNLKVWENITLPLIYHSGEVTAEDEQTALKYLSALGYSGNLMSLPAHLSSHEKRIITLVRALLTRPEIIIYNSSFEDAPSPTRKNFSQLTAQFQASSNDRISLYLASSTDLTTDLSVDTIIHLHNPAETVSRVL